jgi:rRNA maturation RNase YbeY
LSPDDSEPFQLDIREESVPVPVDRRRLRRAAERAFLVADREPADISLVVCTDAFISDLNERYRKRKGPTDVLSFSLREGDFPSSHSLGDIVISVETVEKQSREYGRGVGEEFLHIFLHGLLHLLGFTHDTDAEERVMNETIKKIQSEASRDSWV